MQELMLLKSHIKLQEVHEKADAHASEHNESDLKILTQQMNMQMKLLMEKIMILHTQNMFFINYKTDLGLPCM